jgi:hypothetical protein
MGVTKAFIKNPETVRLKFWRHLLICLAVLPRRRTGSLLAYNGESDPACMASACPTETRGSDEDSAFLEKSEGGPGVCSQAGLRT